MRRVCVRLASCTVDKPLLDLEEVEPDEIATAPYDAQVLLMTFHICRDWFSCELPDGRIVTLTVFGLDIGEVIGCGGQVRPFRGRLPNLQGG